MIGLYFSGTGNTKHCAEYFVKRLDDTAAVYSIEDEGVADAVRQSDEIVFAYPVYYSDLPKIVRDYIVRNAALWQGKKIFIIATMGLFSGDGAGCAARLFKKFGAEISGGLHFKMPDCIGDVKLLKKSLEQNRRIVAKANEKTEKAVAKIQAGKYPKNGLRFAARLAGFFGQRLFFGRKTKRYYRGIKVNDVQCVSCGLCASLCPMQNITLQNGQVTFNDKCVMCYRCFSHCPKQAITIIGKKVIQQSTFEKYDLN